MNRWYSNEVIGADGIIEISEEGKNLKDKDIDAYFRIINKCDPKMAREFMDNRIFTHNFLREEYLKDICLSQISPSLVYGVL